MYNHKWLFLSFFTCWDQFMGIPGNALSIRAVYWGKMSQNIGNIHILWALIWFNEFRLKANGCIIYSTQYFPNEIDMHYVADCIAQKYIFHILTHYRYVQMFIQWLLCSKYSMSHRAFLKDESTCRLLTEWRLFDTRAPATTRLTGCGWYHKFFITLKVHSFFVEKSNVKSRCALYM